jgi:hypothetical protein
MDKAPAYGAGDSGFESQYGLNAFYLFPPTPSFFCARAPEEYLAVIHIRIE